MKKIHFRILALSLLSTVLLAGCKNEVNSSGIVSDKGSTSSVSDKDFSGTYKQSDQAARPAINTVFIAAGTPKDAFNAAIPSEMGKVYQPVFQTKLLALNPAYSKNALGQTAADLTGLLATDVLNVAKTGCTSFFDGEHVLTGRALADDVIDTELLLIFGGPDGKSNPSLTSDHVDHNDKAFLDSFPYLASPW